MPRFTIIDDVELLNLNAVNSILKLIEEPLKSDYFTNVSSGDKSNVIIIKTKNGKTFKFPNEL